MASELGFEIRRRIGEMDITEEQAAQIIGVSQPTLSRWISGKQRPSKPRHIRALLLTIGMSANEYAHFRAKDAEVEILRDAESALATDPRDL